jgi:hypothetical protein
MKNTFRLALPTLALSLFASSAFANLDCDYRAFVVKNPGQNSDGGKITEIKTSRAVDGSDFAWYATFQPNSSGKMTNAYWVAVSPGPNPKGHAGELAIFYVDASKPGTPVVTSYAYNGVNGDNSYINGNGSGGAADKIWSSKADSSIVKEIVDKTNGNSRTLGFRINPTKIDTHNPKYPGSTPWTGSKYGDKIGVWFHPVTEATTSYGPDDFLTSFKYKNQGWYDVDNMTTFCTDQPVPEPATIAALAFGVAAITRKRRK